MKKEKLKALLAVAVITLALAVSALAVAQDNENESATYAPSIETLIRTIPTQEEEVWAFNASTLPMALSTIITDPKEGKTVDVKQVDAGCTYSGSTLTHVTFSVTYYTSIDQSTLVSYLWLDTDQNPGTGIKASDLPRYGLNDIGADRFIAVYQGYASVVDENFKVIAKLPVSYTSNSYTVTIPISDLADDGCMDVTQISGNYGDPLDICDIAPNTGHGTVDCCIPDGCILTISQLDATNFPTIKAIVMVTDRQGNPIPGLTKSDFTVTENGQNANIISVNCGGAAGPIDVALALDASGSMGSGGIRDTKTAANTFVNYMGTNDKGAIVGFGKNIIVKQTLTSSKTALHNAINNYDSGIDGSATSFYDAIIASVDQVKSSTRIRAVIAMTDGKNNYGTTDVSVPINYALQHGVPVYTIGLGGSVNATVLQQIATQTGGRYYYAASSSDLQQIYTLISEQISSQCEIIWTTPFPCPTTVIDRNVEISVSHGGMTCSDTGVYSYNCYPEINCTLIHLDGKNCVNQPIVARLTDENENPIQGTIIFSLGGSQFPKTTDAQGYTTFTPQITGTLTATFDDTAGTTGKIWTVTCEIIDDPALCVGACNFCQDPTQGTVSITSFTTDKTTYTRGQTIKVTMVVNNAESCIYKKLLTDVSATKSDTGVPLGFSGSWSMVDTGTNTYEMRLYIPTATEPGTYEVYAGVFTDYMANGGTVKDIAGPVYITIS